MVHGRIDQPFRTDLTGQAGKLNDHIEQCTLRTTQGVHESGGVQSDKMARSTTMVSSSC